MLLGKRSKLSLSGTLMDDYIAKFRARANVFLLYSESLMLKASIYFLHIGPLFIVNET